MGWTKNRERLHEAAVSTVRAISRNKKITSNTGVSQRPPSGDHVVISNAPRSTKEINQWRGESDFQAFWYSFHKKSNEIKLTLPARMIFNELEISRVELLGCSKYIGSKKNISKYTDSRSNELQDEKSLNFISYGANLWLKNAAKFDLNDNSKNILKKFIEKYKIDDSKEVFKEELLNNLNDQKLFEKNVLKFLKSLDLFKDDINEED